MKKHACTALILTLIAAQATRPASAAATIIKADNLLALNDPNSWVGNVVPGQNDIALFNNTLAASTTFSLGGDLSWAGIQFTNPANNLSFLSDGHSLTLGSAGIDMSAATKNLTLSNLLNLGTNQTWAVASQLSILSNLVVEPNPNLLPQLTKSGTGTLSLGGTNVFSTSVAINGGTIKLLAKDSFDFRRIYLNNEDNYANAIRFTDNTDVLDLNGFDATAGPILGPGHITNSGTASATLYIPAFLARQSLPDFLATIDDGVGGISIDRNRGGSTGTANIMEIATQQTYTGSTTLHEGITTLKFSPALGNSPIISSQSHLILAGGTLRAISDAAQLYSQSFNGTDIQAGYDAITAALNGSITLGALTRSQVGGSMLFSISTTNANTAVYATASNTPSGILGGWAFVSGTVSSNTPTWAVVDGTGKIVPLAPAAFSSSALGAASFAPTANTDLVGNLDLTSASPNLHTGSLRFSANGTLTLNGINAIDSGGILLVNSPTAALITGGSGLTSGNGHDLIVNNYRPTGVTSPTFSIASPIVNANGGTTPIALVVEGFGALRLSGANTYSGGTFLYQGMIFADTSASLGTGTVQIRSTDLIVPNLVLGNGLSFSNNFDLIELQENPPFTLGPIINVPLGSSATLAGNISATSEMPYSVYRMGTSGGTLVLTGASVSGTPGPTGQSQRTIFLGSQAILIATPTQPVTHIILAEHASLVSYGTSLSMRQVNLLLKDQASMTLVGTPNFGWGFMMGVNYDAASQPFEICILTLQDSATIDVGPFAFDLAATKPANTNSINFNGGSITLGQFIKSNGSTNAMLNLNGGTFVAAQDSSAFLPTLSNTTALVQTGGAKFNTNGHSITLTQSLLHDAALSATPDGGLTKLGAGILTLASSANTFTGPLSIQQDTVSLATPLPLKINALAMAHTNTGSSAVYSSALQLNASRLTLQSADPTDKANKILAINEAIFAGHNGTNNTWSANKGITSAAVAADPQHLTLGVYDNAALHSLTLPGQPRTNWAGGTGNVDTNSLLITPALKGDANLDGLIDIADMVVIANNWNLAGKSNGISTIDMAHGDVNQDGIVDIADMVVIANNWNQTSSFNLSTALSQFLLPGDPSLALPIPEPSSVALLLLVSPLLLRRKDITWVRRARRTGTLPASPHDRNTVLAVPPI